MVLWAVFLAITVVLFIVINSIILPKMFLKEDYSSLLPNDRGLKRIKEINGQSIIYEPDVKTRKWVKQYILSERDGKKMFIAKIDENIQFIDFDIVVYNDECTAVKVLNIKQLIENKGYTQICELPEETAYVSFVLNSADSEVLKRSNAGQTNLKRMGVFIGLSAVTDVLCIIGVKIFAAKLFGGIFGESFIVSGKTWGITGAICAGVVILHAAITVLTVYLKSKHNKPAGGVK